MAALGPRWAIGNRDDVEAWIFQSGPPSGLGGVRGGRLYGEWPGLEPEQLYERRDLAVTTDFRDVLGEVVSGHLGQKVDQVFPGYAPKKSLGLLAASG